MNEEERDILIRLDQNVANLINTVDSHVESDKQAFRELTEKDKIHDRLLWMAIGIIAFINFALKFIKI